MDVDRPLLDLCPTRDRVEQLIQSVGRSSAAAAELDRLRAENAALKREIERLLRHGRGGER